eukprot:3941080-Amphidinium_carterae.1
MCPTQMREVLDQTPTTCPAKLLTWRTPFTSTIASPAFSLRFRVHHDTGSRGNQAQTKTNKNDMSK